MAIVGNPAELDLINTVFINPNEKTVLFEASDALTIYADPLYETTVLDTCVLVSKLIDTPQRELWLVTLDTSGVLIQTWIKKAVVVAPL